MSAHVCIKLRSYEKVRPRRPRQDPLKILEKLTPRELILIGGSRSGAFVASTEAPVLPVSDNP
jgi:hypothetical protein